MASQNIGCWLIMWIEDIKGKSGEGWEINRKREENLLPQTMTKFMVIWNKYLDIYKICLNFFFKFNEEKSVID